MMVSTPNAASTTSCAITNGASDCVGASALSSAILPKPWTISTNTLNQSATMAVTT